MAQFDEVINLRVNEADSGVKSVKSIKTEIRQAKEEAIQLARQFGEFSTQANQAAKRYADLQDELGDFNQRVAALNPDRFEKFAKLTSGIAGGISAAQGAMALFGEESEDVQRTLLKVQAAMAFAQGAQQLVDLKNGLGALGASIKSAVIPAFQSLAGAARAVGAALGIGLIITAVSLIVGYWDKIKELVSGVSREQTKVLETTRKHTEAEREKLDYIGNQENILKLQGKSEREILQIKIAQTDEVIAGLSAQLAQQKAIQQSQIDTAARNQRILTGILKFITAPIQLLLSGVDALGKALGENFNLADRFNKSITSLVFDPDEVREEGNKTQKELQKQIDELKNQRAGYQLAIQSIDTKAATDAKAALDKAQEERLKSLKESIVQEEELRRMRDQIEIDAMIDSREKRLAQFDLDYLSKRDALVKAGATAEDIQKDYAQKLAAFNEAEQQKENEEFMKALGEEIQMVQESGAALHDSDKRIADARKAVRASVYKDTLSILGSLSELVGKTTAAGKVFALAQIAADTAVAISGALANSQSPLDPANAVTGGLAGVAKFASIAAVIFSNINRAKQILQGGSSSSADISTSQPQFVMPRMASLTPGSDRLRGVKTDNKVYVLEHEISSSQNRVEVLNAAGRF